MNKTKEPENRAYTVTIVLLVGLAAFSTAMKDLNRLQEMVSSVQEFTSQWRGSDLVTVNEKPISTAVSSPISTTTSCPNGSPEMINSAAESGSSDGIASAATEIKGIDYEIITEPEIGGKVKLVANKMANRNLPRLRAKYAPASNLREVISASRRNVHWPAHFEFKTSDRTVTLDLPVTMLTNIKADALEAELSPGFPQSLLGKINRRLSHGKNDNGRREIMFKKFERNVSPRPVS